MLPYSTLALIELVVLFVAVMLSFLALIILGVCGRIEEYGYYVVYFMLGMLLLTVLLSPLYVIRPDWLTDILIGFGW